MKNSFLGYSFGIAAIIGLIFSIYLDLHSSVNQWTQRSGTLLIISGAFIGFWDSTENIVFTGDDIIIDFSENRKRVGLIFILVGTILTGYGDILIEKIQ